jgi:hypothetical protein
MIDEARLLAPNELEEEVLSWPLTHDRAESRFRRRHLSYSRTAAVSSAHLQLSTLFLTIEFFR